MTSTIPDVKPLVGRALRELRIELDVAQQDLAEKTDKTPGSISLAEKHNGIDSLTLMREYEYALGLPFGSLLLRAGLVEAPTSTADVIRADNSLNQQGKRFVLSAYEMAKEQSGA